MLRIICHAGRPYDAGNERPCRDLVCGAAPSGMATRAMRATNGQDGGSVACNRTAPGVTGAA